MTKIKVSSLQPGPQMDALVAMARGWWTDGVGYVFTDGTRDYLYDLLCKDYNPSTNGRQCFELMEAYPMVYGYNEETGGHRAQCLYGHVVELGDSETIAVAVCKAVIAAHFGDEVEIN